MVQLTLGVLLEKLLLALLIGASDDELVLVLDTGPSDSGDGVLEASCQQSSRNGGLVDGGVSRALDKHTHMHSREPLMLSGRTR